MFILEILALLMPMFQPAPEVKVAMQAAHRINSAAHGAVLETISWQASCPAIAWHSAIETELTDDESYAARVKSAIEQAVDKTGADPTMLWSVAFTESHGRHWSSPGMVKRGGSGEIGMMQVMPFWSRSLEKKYGVALDLFDLEDNVLAGAYILSRGGKSPHEMLSYYNTGQRVRSTAYQRKVMRYWSKLEEIPDSIGYKKQILAVSAEAWD